MKNRKGVSGLILVTRLNDKELIVNCDLIESIESNPDTTITMTTGRKLIAKEPIDTLMDRVIAYKSRLLEARN